jgi:hypothetical protein
MGRKTRYFALAFQQRVRVLSWCPPNEAALPVQALRCEQDPRLAGQFDEDFPAEAKIQEAQFCVLKTGFLAAEYVGLTK